MVLFQNQLDEILTSKIILFEIADYKRLLLNR